MRSTIGIRQAAKALALAATFTTLVAGAAQASLVTVAEKSGIADTGSNVTAGHQVNVDATGERSGPACGLRLERPTGLVRAGARRGDWPKPGARKYSLLAKVAGKTFKVGNGTTFTPSAGGRIYLQINDDVPGNGDGAFTAYVDVL